MLLTFSAPTYFRHSTISYSGLASLHRVSPLHGLCLLEGCRRTEAILTEAVIKLNIAFGLVLITVGEIKAG